MTKTEKQIEQMTIWRNAGGVGGFENPTGFGKMYMTVNFGIKPILEKNPLAFIIVVVHSDSLRDQWRKVILKYIPEIRPDSVLVETVQMFLAKGLQHTCHTIILDEVDEYFGPERRKIWTGELIRFKFLCWLSATPEDRHKRDTEFFAKFPCLVKITEDEALTNGWISQYREFNIGVSLTEQERQEYDDATALFNKQFAKFNNRFTVVGNCLKKEAADDYGKVWTGWQWACGVAAKNGWTPQYSEWLNDGFPSHFTAVDKHYVEEIHSLWNPGVVIGYAKEVMKWLHIRTTIIYEASGKQDLTIELCRKFPKRKTIVFSQSTKFVDSVTQQLNDEGLLALHYHSNIPSRPLRQNELGVAHILGEGEYVTYKGGQRKGQPKLFSADVIKKQTIEAFALGTRTRLISAMALDKGIDVPDIELAIITSMSQNQNQYRQRRGRAVRVSDSDNPYVYIVNIYARDTRDVEFLKAAQKGSENAYWIDSIEQITDNIVLTEDLIDLENI